MSRGKRIVRDTLAKIYKYSEEWRISKFYLIEILFMSLEDWQDWSDKEDFKISPGHLCSDKVWPIILEGYIRKHPKEIQELTLEEWPW